MTLSTVSQSFFARDPKIANRVLHFHSFARPARLVFVPNWRGKPKHWQGFISELTPNFALDYFESREKPHTQKPQARICYRLETLAADLAAYLNQIEEPYHLMGASIGASSILQAWSNLKQKPQSLALLSPVINLQMPAYFRLFPYISERSVRLVRPLVLAMMKRSKAFAAVSRGLYPAFKSEDLSEILTIKYSAEDLIDTSLVHIPFPSINIPTFVGYTPDDGIHHRDDAEYLLKTLPYAEGSQFESFRMIHQADTAVNVMEWYRRWGIGMKNPN